MKLSEFILLDSEKKKFTVLHQGVLVAKRFDAGDLVFLFQLNNYYVETFCNTHTKAVEEYRVFDGTRLLQPYIDTIPISPLLD